MILFFYECIFFLFIGVIVVWFSSEAIVHSAQRISLHLKISGTFLGLTVLSIGTTLPELGTHIVSSLEILRGNNLSAIAIGTNIGSNIFQITLILGVAAMYATIKTTKKFMRQDYLVMLGAIILLFVFSFNGVLGRIEGAILVLLYFIYLYFLGKQEHAVSKFNHYKSNRIWYDAFVIFVGIIILYFSSNVVVLNASLLANMWHVSNSLIGIMLLGFGTALPELAAVIISLRRKMPQMSLGVLVGSNITNPLFVIGVGSLIST